MSENKERRKSQRYVIIEDVNKILKDLKQGEIIVDLSLDGAKLLSIGPKKMNELFSFNIQLPDEMGVIDLNGKVARCKMHKFDGSVAYEIGVLFHDVDPVEKTVLGKYISYLERDKVLSEGKEKIKELLSATKKLKKNLLILKCSLNPPKKKDTTQ